MSMAEATIATEGDCPECEQSVSLRKDGRIKKHQIWKRQCSGWGEKPLPPEREFVVSVVIDTKVTVSARTADEAGELIDDIDYNWWNDQEVQGYSISEVVGKDKEHDYSADDERKKCLHQGCNHPVASHTGRWSGIGTPSEVRLDRACAEVFCKCLYPFTQDEDDE